MNSIGNMIRHSVVFKLRHESGSEKERAFLNAASRLAAIPGVSNFEWLRQISTKNNFTLGIFMEFDNSTEFDFYNQHPDHIDFIENFWKPNVEDFLELDFEAVNQG